MDPNEITYALQLFAWAVLWAAVGLEARQWIARKDAERHRAGR